MDYLATYGFGPRFLTYIREIYRHPTLQHCIEGFFTEPIQLHCGILQGDPMSCLLYNFSLQPMLDFAKHHHQAGVKLKWDAAQPLFVSSLAFADDVLLIVNNKENLAKFLDALDLYEMASNAKVNEDKLQAFFFVRAHDENGDLGADEIPFPVIGQSSAEIVHLGYPFRLDGGVPSETIEKQLSAIQTKVNILASTKTTLAAQARICNSFLLSKLWHSLRLCPLSNTLQQRVNTIVNPFLFLGWRNWIKHDYVVAPRHLGSLGVIDTMQMSIALLGQMVVGLLPSTEPVGAQFRQALQEHLWTQYRSIPAHFVLRHGQPWIKMVSTVTVQKLFMCWVVYTLTQLRLTVEPDWDSITVPELLALPFYNNMYSFTWPDVHVASQQSWERNGLQVWGDILWYNTNEKGKILHTNMVHMVYPLVPPSASGIKNNYVASRGHPDERLLFSDAAGRHIPTLWKEFWPKLHPTVVRKLLVICRHYDIHPDNLKSKKNPLPHDRPFKIDTVGLPFPWRFAKLANKPIAEYTVWQACAFLARSDPIMPDWPFDSTPEQWRQVWQRHTQNSLLTSQATSDVFLFLHRHPWLAQKPRNDRRLGNYNDLNNHSTSSGIYLHDHDVEEALNNPEAENNAYESKHIFGVAPCTLCNEPHDSAIHGFIECSVVQKEAWRYCLPTL